MILLIFSKKKKEEKAKRRRNEPQVQLSVQRIECCQLIKNIHPLPWYESYTPPSKGQVVTVQIFMLVICLFFLGSFIMTEYSWISTLFELFT